MLDDLGLVPALQCRPAKPPGAPASWVNVATDRVSDELSDDYKTCVYRVVQEALHNASKHAAARQIRVTVRQETERLVVSVQDDGRGFEPKIERGLGLLGMERVATGRKFPHRFRARQRNPPRRSIPPLNGRHGPE